MTAAESCCGAGASGIGRCSNADGIASTDASVSVYMAHRGVFLWFVEEIVSAEKEREFGAVRAVSGIYTGT